ALISHFSAVTKIGKVEFAGFFAWLAWLLLHLLYLVGHRNRIAAAFSWGLAFLGRTRGQMAITSQMVYARLAMRYVQARAEEGALAAAEQA
ncbi:NAD(P)/FAD-dependent oxidoreductase, partial [Mycobacterium kansasii]